MDADVPQRARVGWLMATLTGLEAGTYLALTDKQLKALRACKGDPARRERLETLACERLNVAEAWQFLATIGSTWLYMGKSLHRGQFHLIMQLDVGALSAELATLGKLDLRREFFAINEEKFRYHNVTFWVAEQWQREGRTTVLDDAVFAIVERGLKKLTKFVAAAVAKDLNVLFTMSV